jgi:dolichyl-phosphate beta-glucosyltransferase
MAADKKRLDETIASLDLSIVIPAYKERKRLPTTFSEMRLWLDRQGISYEVVVVADPSPDETVAYCLETGKTWPNLRCFEQKKRFGKGAAVRRGCLEAKGKNILITDADHSTPIDTLALFLPFMTEYDMVVGVRTFSGDGESSSIFRRIVGLTQQLLAHILVFRKSVADSQCGFKLLSRSSAREIFSRACIAGGMFDVELFFIAHKRDYRIFSKPVKWVHKSGSTINVGLCMLTDPLSLVWIRVMDVFRHYN